MLVWLVKNVLDGAVAVLSSSFYEGIAPKLGMSNHEQQTEAIYKGKKDGA